MNKEDLLTYLRLGANSLKNGSNHFLAQPALSSAMRLAGGLLDIGATLVERGHDPVEHITRLVDLDAELNAVRAQVDAEADEDQRGR